jgi:hypothetical protein
VKQDGTRGQCILDAFSPREAEGDYADDLSRELGIPAEAIRENPTGMIMDEIVDAAPVRLKPALRKARERGQPICGRVMEQQLGGRAR